MTFGKKTSSHEAKLQKAAEKVPSPFGRGLGRGLEWERKETYLILLPLPLGEGWGEGLTELNPPLTPPKGRGIMISLPRPLTPALSAKGEEFEERDSRDF